MAVSDPLGIVAQSVGHVRNDDNLIDGIANTVEKFAAELIVVGMPYNLKGEVGKKALEVERFIEALKKQICVEIRTWDERFSSTIARRTMHRIGMKRAQRQKKGRADEIAASVILQSYLDALVR